MKRLVGSCAAAALLVVGSRVPGVGAATDCAALALNAGQNQIVALNRGAADGMERGNVLALWREGRITRDETDPARPQITLPDERHGPCSSAPTATSAQSNASPSTTIIQSRSAMRNASTASPSSSRSSSPTAA